MSAIILNVLGGLIVGALLGITGYVMRKAITGYLRQKWFYRKTRENLKQLRNSVSARGHWAAGMLMTIIAKESAAHLLAKEGEEVTLDEYEDLLEASLCEGLGECLFVSRAKPSDWYLSRTDKGAVRDFKIRIKEYLNKQKQLKGIMGDRLTIKRYMVLPQKVWEQEDKDKKKQFRRDHREKGREIELYFCPLEDLPPDFPARDMAIFRDREGKGWVIESLNFDENVMKKYMSSGLSPHLRIRIQDDQALLEAKYSHIQKRLEERSQRL